jgi:hypothetical protein
LDPTRKIIPDLPVLHDRDKQEAVSVAPEEKIFDKAVEAASLEELKKSREAVREGLKAAKTALQAANPDGRDEIRRQIAALESREQWCTDTIAQRESGE